MSRTLTPRGQHRRDELLAYATAYFAERGYHVTSVADIVAGLGVGKGVFYWYSDSKGPAVRRDPPQRPARAPGKRSGSRSVTSVTRSAGSRPASARRSPAAEHPHRHDLMRMAAREDLVKHIRDAMAERGVHDTDPGLVAEAILGVTQRLGRVAFRGESPSPTAAADAAVAFCLGGLLGRPVVR
jgi:hypothetical protein